MTKRKIGEEVYIVKINREFTSAIGATRIEKIMIHFKKIEHIMFEYIYYYPCAAKDSSKLDYIKTLYMVDMKYYDGSNFFKTYEEAYKSLNVDVNAETRKKTL